MAFDMFSQDPSKSMNLTPGKPLDVSSVGASLTGIVIKVLLLLVMGLIGSLVANRGITLYARSADHRKVQDKSPD